MAQDFGNGVSRTLSAKNRQFLQTVWQASKPPLDSELNLVAQISNEQLREAVQSEMHSGFVMNPCAAESSFVTNPNWSNWFQFGNPDSGSAPFLWANVNGWMIPVSGSSVAEGDLSNRVNLFPPPATDARIDFVFLEVWQAQVAPNPSTVNKPSASTLYKYGNVQYGGTNVADDIQDPTIGFETTERVQLQYRIRVVGSGTGLGDSIDLAQYPDGLDDPNVIAQGTQVSPVAGYTFSNMGVGLGDKGLWRAGNGDETSRSDLGSVDGYTYAVPMCAIFRRNYGLFKAIDTGNANQNGSFDRNPTSGAITDPVQSARTFAPVTLVGALAPNFTGLVSVSGLAGSGLDNINILWSSTVLMVGDEILTVSAIDASAGTITVDSRGRLGTQATLHEAGSSFGLYTFRPDGKFSDQIDSSDILDLRRSVTLGEWSYESVLKHNLGKLLSGNLRSSYKQGSGTDTQGTRIIEVDSLLGRGAGSLPPQTEQLDGFDGIRTVFSDSACVQNHVSIALVPDSGAVNTSTDWEVAADFDVSGFIPDGDSFWKNGAVIRLFIGGSSGQDGARKTSASSSTFMRFVGPKEYWLSRDQMPVSTPESSSLGNQTPFLMRFIGNSTTGPQVWSQPAGLAEPPAQHPGPMFPLPDQGFEFPYAVLGGVVNSELTESAVAVTHVAGSVIEVQFTGQDFDAVGAWVSNPASPRTSSLEGISKTLLHGKKNLYDMLTNGGRDVTGMTSELYLFLTGGVTDSGLFRVTGAGTSSYTSSAATASDRLRVEPVGVGSSISLGETVNAEVRSLYTNTEDNIGSSSAAVVVVITDILGTKGGATNPWNGVVGAPSDLLGEMVLDTSILYGPSRGAMARVPDDLLRFAVSNPVGTNILRESPENKDSSPSDIRGRTGAPEDEYYYGSQPLMAWNRLQSLGLTAPAAPNYGEERYNFETSRESELFIDRGSKTVVFRPFRQVSMSLPLRRASTTQIPSNYLDGVTPVDGAGLFTDTDVYDVPLEYMPRFGRQDIPVRENAGTTGPYFGINHLFSDTPIAGDTTRGIVGGASAGLPLKIVTGSSTGFDYGYWDSPNNRYQGRIYTDVNARSTDINKPMKGIQLPPYLGVARVYGVYEKSDYDTNGSAWLNGLGYTPDTGAAKGTNLLRTNADKQTLFIVKDGAADVMAADSDAHTYVVPEEAIDISLHPAYTSGQKFEDLEYVVEVAVFGFAQGFINKNNYVLDRGVYTGNRLVNDIRMVIPTAMPGGVLGYSAYQRTVYQGDPFMTRSAVTLQTADYKSRHGQIPVLDAFALKAPLQQYDTNNDQIPEIPNARGLRILSTVDFWTTLGTGKVGGKVFPGTMVDSGYLESAGGRIPSSSTDNQYQPHTRTLSAGQPEDGNYAEMAVTILDNSSIAGTTLVFERGGDGITLTEGVDWAAGASTTESVEALNKAINNLSSAVGLSLRNNYKVRSHPYGPTLVIQSVIPGDAGRDTFVTISNTLIYELRSGFASYSSRPTRLPLYGGEDVPVNASRVPSAFTPVGVAGMTDRLPLGILVQDSDFLGEDPLRQGVAYSVKSGGGVQSTTEVSTFFGDSQVPSDRLHGAGGEMGMADGAILSYAAYNAVSAPDGTRRFRVYRGGGSVYVLSPEATGGPVDYSAGGFSEGDDPVLKGAVLTGRAYLVHNSYEDAFAGTSVRSYGDEVQMVVVTSAVYGEGAGCELGYALDGIISPTDYGKGYSAADRYRLEGKPMVKSTNAIRDPNVPLIPYPPEDPADDDPCA